MNDTLTHITFDLDDESPDRWIQLFAVTSDNETTCEQCDEDITASDKLAVLVSGDPDMAYPIAMHLKHFMPGDDLFPHMTTLLEA